MTDRDALVGRILDRAAECLAVEAGETEASARSARDSWFTGAKLIQAETTIRKLQAETPPDAKSVTAATSVAKALIEAAIDKCDPTSPPNN